MLMGTQLINPKYFIQGIIWPSSAHLLFSSPYCPQIQTVPSIHLKGGYKSRLKTTKKSKTLLSCFPRQKSHTQDSAVLYCHSCLSPAPCSPPTQIHHHPWFEPRDGSSSSPSTARYHGDDLIHRAKHTPISAVHCPHSKQGMHWEHHQSLIPSGLLLLTPSEMFFVQTGILTY